MQNLESCCNKILLLHPLGWLSSLTIHVARVAIWVANFFCNPDRNFFFLQSGHLHPGAPSDLVAKKFVVRVTILDANYFLFWQSPNCNASLAAIFLGFANTIYACSSWLKNAWLSNLWSSSLT
ncbi:hypothetical protein O6H91_05G038500 [Diphasiastrum complanatum]|uniref:Uncharacterized protein n=1 Tax=Diphasiastrum complanatum TaxID=34168 RepID=A0ACC2DME1_DIPCM|nr:hypothetical protein O6H91_05G038500 [Diphasiastrum complanatum]